MIHQPAYSEWGGYTPWKVERKGSGVIYRQKLIVAVISRPLTKSMPNAPTRGTTR